MNLSNFSSLMVENANEAKNLMSLLIGHYRNDQSAPAILGLFESFPDDYKKETKLFAPVFLKFFNTYKMTDITYPYYKKWKNNYASDVHKKIQDNNPNWNWGEESKITFKNSLELAKALNVYQKSQYSYEEKTYQTAIPFFKEFESEIERLVKKDKNKLIENFHKYKVWEFFIRDNYHFMKLFCHQHDMDLMEIVRKEIGGSFGYGISDYIGYYEMPLEQFDLLLDDIKEYGEEAFFAESNFFKDVDKTSTMNLNIAENVLYALCYDKFGHGSLLANKFKEKLIEYLPWEGDDPYDNEKWKIYCEDKKTSQYGRGMQSHHFKHMSEDVIGNIGTILKKADLKMRLDKDLQENTTEIPLIKL